MKKIIFIPIMLLTLVFAFLFTNNDVYAVEIDTDLRFNKVLYQMYFHDNDTGLDYFDIYLDTSHSTNEVYSKNLLEISLNLMALPQNTYIYTLNPNYLIELYRGTGNNRVFYDDIGYVSLIYATYSAGDYEFAFYNNNHEYITTIRPTDLSYDDIFLHTSYINQSATIDNAFESGRIQGYNDGVRSGDREGYERGLQRGRELFAYYDEVNEQYIPAVNWGITEYNRGLNEGLQSSEGEAFDAGYDKGYNDRFATDLPKWLPSSIIIVLIGGLIVSVIIKKRGSE